MPPPDDSTLQDHIGPTVSSNSAEEFGCLDESIQFEEASRSETTRWPHSKLASQSSAIMTVSHQHVGCEKEAVKTMHSSCALPTLA